MKGRFARNEINMIEGTFSWRNGDHLKKWRSSEEIQGGDGHKPKRGTNSVQFVYL